MKLDFEQYFYNYYPRKVGKGQARKTWEKLDSAKYGHDEDDLAKKMQLAIQAQIKWRTWDDRAPDWKHPSTWLTGECWDDQIPSRTDKPPAPTDIKKCPCGKPAKHTNGECDECLTKRLNRTPGTLCYQNARLLKQYHDDHNLSTTDYSQARKHLEKLRKSMG